MPPLQPLLGSSPSNRHAPVTVCIIGTGNKGTTYTSFALQHPQLMKVVAVVSPVDFRRNILSERLELPSDRVFCDWRELASLPKIADAVLITSTDSSIEEVSIVFAQKKYHILLEEPQAIDLGRCQAVVEAAAKNSVIFSVGNTIRYKPCNRTLKKMLDSGSIGEIMSIQHIEKVGFQSIPHLNIRRRKDTSLSLVSKSIDGIDLVSWLMDSPCRKVSAFGSLFQGGNRKSENPFVYSEIYSNPIVIRESEWTPYLSGIVNVEIADAGLTMGDSCSYASPLETEVCDSHIVNMEFDEGKTCSFTMISGSSQTSRMTRIFGTLGELECDGNVIKHFDFLTRRSELIRPDINAAGEAVENDGDYGLIEEFLENIRWGRGQWGREHGFEELRSRMYALAAEQARASGSVVNIDDCRSKWFGDRMEVC
ncbi:NAD(P)-binding protein [Basidiobolus meristosporus CBS 931.73]|uniref:NAD(P)-binding protein n=1 Tax=Basidiobolus meristosporus CBS 931.73 TaxID=1314790 RepID=A0A1Y1X554_9FUNG|nr:NAD(P)-binding protein [Basidiobolus meristosporus CBS 931.73]|eukprot:ORX80913.1 NAD(P)-binding protein [Basidiobolus meristosporus CBS 931.73]